ncbi:MAG: hypothetical protein NTY09_02135 [bacterium]|nr:hypothetical protein [bacterium]
MKWEVKISGDEFDLRKLADSALNEDLRVSERDGQYYLESKRFESMATHEEVIAAASEKLKILTGIARRLFGCRTPLDIASIAEVLEDGKRKYFVSLNVIAHVRATLSGKKQRSDGTVEVVKPADEVSGLKNLAFRDGRVAEVLGLLYKITTLRGEQEQYIWICLYIIDEIIKKDVGGSKKIAGKGWAKTKSIKLFTWTAQSYRHSKEHTKPPPNPMDLEEAQELIEMISGKWLDWKQK